MRGKSFEKSAGARAAEPIPLKLLTSETARLLTSSWGKAWPAWLGVFVAQVFVFIVAAAFAEPVRGLPPWGSALLSIAQVAATSVPYAFGLRIALGASQPLAFDRGLVLSVAANTLCTGLLWAWSLAATKLVYLVIGQDFGGQAVPAESVAGMDRGLVLGLQLISLGGYAGLTIVFVLLSLWPVGLFMREADASPAKSWREMRGATFPILVAFGIGAALAEAAHAGVKGALPPFALGDDPSLLNQFVSSVGYLPANLIITVAYGAIWLIRFEEGARRISAFD